MRKRGAEVMRFGLEDGWDFSKAKHRRVLLDLHYELEPDEIFLNPKCTLWSPMQNINIRTDEDARDLQEKQWQDHEIHVKFCKRLYVQQARNGRHAHIEHPTPSKAWDAPAFKSLPGMKVTFDQCAYGATTWTDQGDWQPIKKTTTLRTTKQAMIWQISKRCQGNHRHHPLEGGQRCREVENYPQLMAKHIAEAIMVDEGLPEQVYATGQDDQLTGILRCLQASSQSRSSQNRGFARPAEEQAMGSQDHCCH